MSDKEKAIVSVSVRVKDMKKMLLTNKKQQKTLLIQLIQFV